MTKPRPRVTAAELRAEARSAHLKTIQAAMCSPGRMGDVIRFVQEETLSIERRLRRQLAKLRAGGNR